jgi:molybdopterin molybdotransferase
VSQPPLRQAVRVAKAIEIEAARREVLSRVRVLPSEEVDLADALGRHLATDAVADAPFQPFDNSAMDGFAVRAPDLAGAGPGNPVTLHLVGESKAGQPATSRSARARPSRSRPAR